MSDTSNDGEHPKDDEAPETSGTEDQGIPADEEDEETDESIAASEAEDDEETGEPMAAAEAEEDEDETDPSEAADELQEGELPEETAPLSLVAEDGDEMAASAAEDASDAEGASDAENVSEAAAAQDDDETDAADGDQSSEDALPPKERALKAMRLEAKVEAIIFASPKPIKPPEIVELIGDESITVQNVEATLAQLVDSYERRCGGFRLVYQKRQGYQFRTAQDAAAIMERMFASRPRPISRAALETLAIIAYRQPVTRAEIEFIRGVDAGSLVKSLLERELIKCVGRKEVVGRPMLFGTTEEFLKVFNLGSLKDLPPLESFQPSREAMQGAMDKIEGDSGEPVDIEQYIADNTDGGEGEDETALEGAEGADEIPQDQAEGQPSADDAAPMAEAAGEDGEAGEPSAADEEAGETYAAGEEDAAGDEDVAGESLEEDVSRAGASVAPEDEDEDSYDLASDNATGEPSDERAPVSEGSEEETHDSADEGSDGSEEVPPRAGATGTNGAEDEGDAAAGMAPPEASAPDEEPSADEDLSAEHSPTEDDGELES